MKTEAKDFSETGEQNLLRLVSLSVVFHLLVVFAIVLFQMAGQAEAHQTPIILDLVSLPTPKSATPPPKPVAPLPSEQVKKTEIPEKVVKEIVKKAPSPKVKKKKVAKKKTVEKKKVEKVAKLMKDTLIEKKEEWEDLPDFDVAPGKKSANSDNPLLALYQQQVRRVMKQNFRPPAGLEGKKPVVSFVIARTGSIGTIHLKTSSGNGTLDQLALRAVRVSRLPPLPPTWAGNTLSIDYGFDYVR